MPLGGSITQGVGSTDGNGYRQELMKLLRDNHFDVKMFGSRRTGTMEDNAHEGWRGFRLDEIERKAKRCLDNMNIDMRPNIFAINAGSNDCLQDFQLNSIGARMANLIEHLWTICPDATVLLSTLVVHRDPEVNARVLKTNEALRALVEEYADKSKRIVLADMHSPEGPVVGDLGNDGTHPGDFGYRKMARVWLSAIKQASSEEMLP